MKLSEIKKLYTKTAITKLDDNFFKELYRVSVNAIESIADTIIIEEFSRATNSNNNIEQIRVYLNKNNNKINIELIASINYRYQNTIYIDNKTNFDFHEFTMIISANPDVILVGLDWDNNGFDVDTAKEILKSISVTFILQLLLGYQLIFSISNKSKNILKSCMAYYK